MTLDFHDEDIEEAIGIKADIVISHHPLIFDPLDSLIDSTDPGRKVMKLIENRISAYTAHSNYDIMDGGLNDILAKKLGLGDVKYISAGKKQWYKFVVFVPRDSQEKIMKAICSNGGGKFRDYSCCTYSSRGRGTFLQVRMQIHTSVVQGS